MQSLSSKPKLLIEPFAGGATIALTAVCENWVDHALIIELDPDVAAVWQVVEAGDALALADCILTFDLTYDNVQSELAKEAKTTLERAFRTILKNRTFHGGILAPGSGLIKAGEAGKGLASRWYPETLAKRFTALHQVRHRLTIECRDCMPVLERYKDDAQAVFFVDPPYTAGGKSAGKRLYAYFELNHNNLFEACSQLTGDFLMTYDDADEVHDFVHQYSLMSKLVPMKNTHHAPMTELVIGRDLTWL
ncbi:MAG: DNA adenine methylase [Brachymonas sp.]|nr:DNA adenine methylase [Brachymonas sp.]